MEERTLEGRAAEALGLVLAADAVERFAQSLERERRLLGDRSLWHVNSAAASGGVAELLDGLLPYALGAGLDIHWLVVGGSGEDFFELTKRIHNRLHEDKGDDGPLGGAERERYEVGLAAEGAKLIAAVRPNDVVVLHDPQTAALIPLLRDLGATVVWRCHVGVDDAGPLAVSAWDFLRRYVDDAHWCVFSRVNYVWGGLDPDRVSVIAPCLDVLSPKNRPLDHAACGAILSAAGILGTREPEARDRGQRARSLIAHPTQMLELVPIPDHARIALQVSRWDRLKDPVGVIRGFVGVDAAPVHGHLVLAGPSIDLDDDDPEGRGVFEEVRDTWSALDENDRCRVHLACMPVDDFDENALVVNALQRRADVVIQKSLAEGFGLTVTEAMWKRRPVVASGIGGIRDQIVSGESGVLIEDPTDLDEYGRAVHGLLANPEWATTLGEAAHNRVCSRYLPTHHYEQELALLESVLG